jgi:uncharacterized protein (DUF885 family)
VSTVSAYDHFASDFHNHYTRNPNARVSLGVDRDLDELPDPSSAAVDDEVSEARGLLRRLAELERADVSFDQRLDLELARLTLEYEIHHKNSLLNGRPRRQQLPRAGAEIGNGIFLMFVNDPRPAAERLTDITGRLERVPAYLDALLEDLDTPVERWVGMDVEKVRGLSGLFGTIADWAREEGWSELPRLESARSSAEAALAQYAERLRDLPTTTRIHLGEDATRRTVSLRGIDKPLDELHRIASDFLAETKTAIEELRSRLTAKYDLAPETTVDELHAFLSRKFRVQLPTGNLIDVLHRYEAERARILEFIDARRLFPIFEEQDMRIIRTPDFMVPSIPAGAMMDPPPFREGVRTSLIYLTLSEELLDEHTELSIPGMMIHEGIPGHHLQLATASTHPSVIRRHADYMDQGEGWTTMLEDYMLDVGYMGDLTEEARFSAKRGLNRIGARVAIDLYFMSGERDYLDVGVDCDLSSPDAFVAAGSLLRAVTGFVPERVETELNWYSQEPGYPLSYLTGNHLVWELKNDVTAAQKGRLEGIELDRTFHDTFLEAGNMPVKLLRRVFRHRGLLH